MLQSEDVLGISSQTILIYTWVFFGVTCQIINIFGIFTNIVNIMCFVKQGFKDSVNISLIGLSVSDLGSLTTMVWTCVCMTPAMMAADLPFEPLEVTYLASAIPHLSFTRVSTCITAMITLERCLCITLPLKVKGLITPHRTAWITACVFITFFFSGSPVYAVNRLGIRFSTLRNKSHVGLITMGDRQNIDMISFAINNFVIPFCAFVIIVVCTSILTFKLNNTIKWRTKSIGSMELDRVSSRNQKTAKMVVMISTLFIVCFVPVSIAVLAIAILPELSVNGKYMNVSILISGLGYAMESINSSTNIFIYYNMGSRYKERFRHMFRFHKMEFKGSCKVI